jgi:predicted transposase/invertase (TIGR01784 family)
MTIQLSCRRLNFPPLNSYAIADEIVGLSDRPSSMKTDSIFYQLFHTVPEILLELAGQPPQAAQHYEFRSVELKQTAFRIDGVLLPRPTASDRTVIFTEVQFQSDQKLYHRFFGEIFLYLRQYPATYDWQGILVYPQRSLEPTESRLYQVLLESTKVLRVYLNELGNVEELPLGLGLIRLVVEPEASTPEAARQLVERAKVEPLMTSSAEVIQSIATIMVYKFTHLSREEIEAMLGFTSQIKQSRVYQEAKQEGREEGREEGLEKGLIESILEILRQRFETVPSTIAQQLQQVTEIDVLKSLVRQAIVTTSLDQFEQAIVVRLEVNEDSDHFLL